MKNTNFINFLLNETHLKTNNKFLFNNIKYFNHDATHRDRQRAAHNLIRLLGSL